jgi:hypothetical protein
MCLTGFSSSPRAGSGLTLDVRRVDMGVLLLLLLLAMPMAMLLLLPPLTSSGARAGERVRRIVRRSVADCTRGRTRLAMLLLERKSRVWQFHLSLMAMLSCHPSRAGRGQGKTRRLGGGQARSGCFCRRAAALGQLHCRLAQSISEANQSLAQNLKILEHVYPSVTILCRQPMFGYSNALEVAWRHVGIDQSKAYILAFHKRRHQTAYRASSFFLELLKLVCKVSEQVSGNMYSVGAHVAVQHVITH